MKFFKYVLFLLLIAIIGLSIYIAVQPNSFTKSAQTTINAPAEVIYATLLDSSTTDRSAFWKENEVLQSTSMTEPFIIQKYFSSSDLPNSELSWKLTPKEDGTTEVIKTIDAKKMSFLFKAKNVFSSKSVDGIDEQLNADLKLLKSDVLKSMEVYSIKVDGITEYGGGFYMYKTTSASASNISNMMGKQYGEIMNFMHDHNVQAAGMPFTIYNEMNDNGSVIMSNAIPVRDKVIVAEDSNILNGYIEKTRAVKTILKGDYTNLGEGWKAAMKYLKDNKLEQSEQHPFEIYVTDPGNTPNPANYITEIYIPIKETVVETEVE
ncbi:MAG: GyrI-like domain-containing protein [Aquaticitalea sp.]